MTPYEQSRNIAQTLLAIEDPSSLTREKIADAVDRALAIKPAWPSVLRKIKPVAFGWSDPLREHD
jgi:hypothetical protein